MDSHDARSWSLQAALAKLGVRTSEAAEWGWALARIAIVAITALGNTLFLRGTTAHGFIFACLAFVLIYNGLLLALLRRKRVWFVFAVGFLLDNLTLLVGWLVVARSLAGSLLTNDLYLILFPVLSVGVARLGWVLGSVYTVFWLAWMSWSSLHHYPPASYDVQQLPVRLLFMAITAGLTMRLVARLELERGRVEEANRQLMLAYDKTLEGWARALEFHDSETEGHSQRVVEMTVRLARKMGLSEEELVHIRRGALLHDIGKIAIPAAILQKPGPLTEEEWRIMRQHPVYAYELLAPIAYLRPALDIPYCHHERWDGSGYPRGLKGEEIPLAARIFAVVDVWDALRFDRPYREAWPEELVRQYFREQAGIQFDPQVVAAFLDMDWSLDRDELEDTNARKNAQSLSQETFLTR